MKILLTLLAAVSFLLISSCNTMQGLGRDISAGGQKLEKAAH